MSREKILSITKKDLEITYFSGTGAGGQYRNKHQNSVRIRHPETGIIVTGTKQRSKTQNEKDAIRALANHPEFLKWLKIQCSSILKDEETLEQKVDYSMREDNLRVEYL